MIIINFLVNPSPFQAREESPSYVKEPSLFSIQEDRTYVKGVLLPPFFDSDYL